MGRGLDNNLKRTARVLIGLVELESVADLK